MSKHFRVPVTIRGITYESIRDAAAAMRCSESTVINFRAAGTLDELGTRKKRIPNRSGVTNGQWQKKPITIRGIEYPSVLDAANALGVTPSAISKAKLRGYIDSIGLGKRGRPPKKQAT